MWCDERNFFVFRSYLNIVKKYHKLLIKISLSNCLFKYITEKYINSDYVKNYLGLFNRIFLLINEKHLYITYTYNYNNKGLIKLLVKVRLQKHIKYLV